MGTVVGLSGVQGAGKSSLLDELKNRGWEVDDFKVSRTVQAALGWETLATVLDDPSTMVKFQDEVLKQKLLRDQELRWGGRQGVILTERTFADIYAYAAHWSWELVDKRAWTLNTAAAWLAGYCERCADAQRRCYDAVLLLPLMDHIIWENDPNRADRASAQTVWDNITNFTSRQTLSVPQIPITKRGVGERADEVEIALREIILGSMT